MAKKTEVLYFKKMLYQFIQKLLFTFFRNVCYNIVEFLIF